MSAFTMTDGTDTDLQDWMDGHHRVEYPSAKTGDEEIHVYAQAANGNPVYGEDVWISSGGYDIQVPRKWGTLQVHVNFDFDESVMSAELGCALPFHPTLRLVKTTSSLPEGVTVQFAVSFVSGKITLYPKDGWLRMSIDGAAMGEKMMFDIKLISIH
ncbi:hypothetical protein [Nocardiopsis synnemataformans]|uniref:hypothetical protein n=1 Tax=Nocardiopsis synnemataformans TaxID=61305 RepID=UPI003EBA7A65